MNVLHYILGYGEANADGMAMITFARYDLYRVILNDNARRLRHVFDYYKEKDRTVEQATVLMNDIKQAIEKKIESDGGRKIKPKCFWIFCY